MPPRPPHPVRDVARATPPERFASCSRVLYAPPETGPGDVAAKAAVEEIAYRRCPVGLIAAVDCPEFAGLRCLHHDPRGARPKTVVPRSEVAMLAAELADSGYLTETYRRRLKALRVAVPAMRPLPADAKPAARSSPPPAPARRVSPLADRTRVPVNVPSDAARRAPKRAGGIDSATGPASP